MIFTAGLPGAGKTTILHRYYDLRNVVVLDLDLEMMNHPDFNPQKPALVYNSKHAYKWANERVEQRFAELLLHPEPLVALDGTGTKIKRQVSRIRRARSAGYSTCLLYVDVTLHTALERQKTRKRRVPPHILRRYQRDIERSLIVEIPLVEEYLRVDNNAWDGLTEEQRWGAILADQIAEQNEVYDAVWMAVAQREHRKRGCGGAPKWLDRICTMDTWTEVNNALDEIADLETSRE